MSGPEAPTPDASGSGTPATQLPLSANREPLPPSPAPSVTHLPLDPTLPPFMPYPGQPHLMDSHGVPSVVSTPAVPLQKMPPARPFPGPSGFSAPPGPGLAAQGSEPGIADLVGQIQDLKTEFGAAWPLVLVFIMSCLRFIQNTLDSGYNTNICVVSRGMISGHRMRETMASYSLVLCCPLLYIVRKCGTALLLHAAACCLQYYCIILSCTQDITHRATVCCHMRFCKYCILIKKHGPKNLFYHNLF